MSSPLDDSTADRQNDQEEPEDPRLSALIEALANGEAIDWQQAESSAGSAEEKERVRALAAISEVATFHRTWLAEAGITGDLDEDDEPAEEVPTHWGELEILERVGRGSFGDVYKAREPRLDRIVALKLIRASARTPEREAETLREGRLLAKVRHPNVATVHGTAGADGRVGFWMEFLEGKNLAEILQEKGRFEPREAAEIGISLCRALAAVHAQGIIHRDVKAQNVVRENDGRIVLTDFGVGRDAKDLQGEEPSLSGTPLYLAPELFEGKPPSPGSDLYALGVLLFYLVTGEFPITGKSFDELRDAHRGRKRRWLKELRKDLPGTFVAAVERALDRDPEKRGDEAGMERELGRFLGERAQVRRLKKVLLAVFVAGAIGVIVPWIYNEIRDQRRERVLAEVKERGAKEPGWAIQKLEEITGDDPTFVEAWRRLGLLRQTGGDHAGSRKAFSNANDLCVGDSSLVCVRAQAYFELSCLRYEKAVTLFLRVVYKDQNDSDSWRQIGMAYTNLAQPEKGIEAAKQAGERSPDNAVAVGLLPLVLAEASDLSALKAVSEARSRLGSERYLRWPEGIAEMVRGTRGNAFKAFTQLSEDLRFASLGEIFKAQIRMEEGNLVEAEALLENGLSSDQGSSPRDVELRQILLAEIEYLRGDQLSARQHLEILLSPQKGEIATIPENLKLLRSASIVAVRADALAIADRFSTKISDLAGRFPSRISEAIDAQVTGEIAAAMSNAGKAKSDFDRALQVRNDPFLQASRLRLLLEQGQCESAEYLAGQIEKKPGLIYADYFVPWIEIREAIDLAKTCTPK